MVLYPTDWRAEFLSAQLKVLQGRKDKNILLLEGTVARRLSLSDDVHVKG